MKKSIKNTTKKKVSKATKKATAKKAVKKTSKSVKKVNKKVTKKVTKKKASKVTKKVTKKPAKKVTKKRIQKKVKVDRNDSVLNANGSFPTDELIQNGMPAGYTPEVRVSTKVAPVSIAVRTTEGSVIETPTPVYETSYRSSSPVVADHRKPSSVPMVLAVILIIMLMAGACFFLFNYFNGSQPITYRLDDLSSSTVKSGLTIEIPSSWTLNGEGKAYVTDTKEVKMVIYVDSYTQDQFDELIASLDATQITTQSNLKGGSLYYIDNLYDSSNSNDEIDYFLFYKDKVLSEFVFSGCDYATEESIIETLGE